jgi:hypothetical protein
VLRRIYDWRRVSMNVAAIFVFLELVSVFVIDAAAAISFCLLFAVAWYWIMRGGNGGIRLFAVLCAAEILLLPFYDRTIAADWLLQGAALVLGIVGLRSAIGELRKDRVAATPAAPEAEQSEFWE